MTIYNSEFYVTVPKSSAVHFDLSEFRNQMNFSVYKMSDYNSFILFDDGIFAFVFKDELGDYHISSN